MLTAMTVTVAPAATGEADHTPWTLNDFDSDGDIIRTVEILGDDRVGEPGW